MKKLFGFLFILALLCSCSSEETCTDCETQQNDSIPEKDTTENLENALKSETVETPSKEQTENHEKIVQKFGEQWDFCTCVIANDSINTAFEGTLTKKQEEKLMARWEHVELKCKEFLTQPNTTPEERAAHEKKVKKCLRNKR